MKNVLKYSCSWLTSCVQQFCLASCAAQSRSRQPPAASCSVQHSKVLFRRVVFYFSCRLHIVWTPNPPAFSLTEEVCSDVCIFAQWVMPRAAGKDCCCNYQRLAYSLGCTIWVQGLFIYSVGLSGSTRRPFGPFAPHCSVLQHVHRNHANTSRKDWTMSRNHFALQST